MNKNHKNKILSAFLALVFVTLACSSGSTTQPTPTSLPATDTPTPKPTDRPTSTPKPTATPNVAKTQEAEADLATIQKYVDNGYLSSANGKLYPLTDNTREMAQKNFLDYNLSGYDQDVITDFAVWADLDWTSAAPVNFPEFSGCGFGFRMQPSNFDAYTAMVTNDSVLVTWCFQALKGCGRVGKTRGKGTVKLGNPAKVHFELIVNKGQAYALVNDEFVAEYTLFKDRLTDPGYFAYSIISGTNKDYGTRCTISNGKLWVPNQ